MRLAAILPAFSVWAPVPPPVSSLERCSSELITSERSRLRNLEVAEAEAEAEAEAVAEVEAVAEAAGQEGRGARTVVQGVSELTRG